VPLFGRNGHDPDAREAVVASAATLSRNNASDLRRVKQPWQERSFAYYDVVPEVWFASQFYARGLSKLRLFPALLDDQGELQPAEDPQLDELFNRVQDPHGGRSTMFYNYGTLMFLTGECYLLCTAPEGEEIWEVVSTREIDITDETTVIRRKDDGGQPLIYTTRPGSEESLTPQEAIIYRMWRRHPRKSHLADAPLRASLDICEELVLLTLGIRARIRSRLSGAGILVIDADVTLPASEEGDLTDEDAFIRRLGEHLMEPIGDEGSASAVVPFLMRIPTAGRKIGDLIEHIRVHNPGEEFPERGMREEAVKRLAVGLDLPPELLLGLAGANHWTSWQIDDQSWELLQPTVQQLVDDLAGAYLRPAAREDGYADWDRLTLGYDESEIVTKPDRSKDAFQAHDRLIISDASAREAGGWNDDDTPDEAELERRMAIKMRDSQLLPQGMRPEPKRVRGTEDAQQPPAKPPEEPPSPSKPNQASVIVGAVEYAVERARELAGSRIRTRLKQCAPCQHNIDGFPNALVASQLGPETVAEAGDELELVRGAGSCLSRVLARQGVEAERAAHLGNLVERHAAQTLYMAEPPPMLLTDLHATVGGH
jgi:hypothetical protein